MRHDIEWRELPCRRCLRAVVGSVAVLFVVDSATVRRRQALRHSAGVRGPEVQSAARCDGAGRQRDAATRPRSRICESVVCSIAQNSWKQLKALDN